MRAVDAFCGAGGTSMGLALAVRELGGPDVELDLTAINHWDVAIDTHKANFPWAHHLKDGIQKLNPRDVVLGPLDIFAGSPECIFFSTARGGKPVNDQQRATAWDVLRWISETQPRTLLLENVPEFKKWGPLGPDDKPIKARQGETYRAFRENLRGLGYNIADPILNAADYGDATSRRRLFMLGRRDGKPIHVPRPTHSSPRRPVPGTRPWRSAREIIDWSRHGESIWGRRRPLSPKTLKRIAAGFEKQGPHLAPLARAVVDGSGPVPLRLLLDATGAADLRSFLVKLYGTSTTASLEEPAPTVTASGEHLALAQPILVASGGPARVAEGRALGAPLPTLLGREHLALAAPVLLHLTHGARQHDAGAPLPTVTGANRGELAIAQPVILGQQGGGAAREVGEPVPTVTGGGVLRVAEPMVLPPLGIMQRGGNANQARSVADPLATLTQRGGGHLVLADVLVPQFGEAPGQAPRHHDTRDPLPAVTSHGAGALALATVLLSYYGNSGPQSLDAPLGTQTTHDRHALAEAWLEGCMVDVRLRMLAPEELAASMGFPPGYKFTGTRTQVVKQIGNAVCVNLAKALALGLLTDTPTPVVEAAAAPPMPAQVPRRARRMPTATPGDLAAQARLEVADAA